MIGEEKKRAPRWFRLAALILVLWGAMGVSACVSQLRYGAEAMGATSDYDRALFAKLPLWYRADYAVATGTMLAGALALLLRSRLAVG